ncbi:hypothetical protein XELAEV_180032915mg, partial [Xenopus laevis]
RERFFSRLLRTVRLHQLSLSTLRNILISEDQLLKSTDCFSNINSAIKRVEDACGLFPDARLSTTEKYIFVHKTAEDKEKQYTFCYNLKMDKWLELPHIHLPDLPGSSLSSYGEKIFITGGCKGHCCRGVRLHIAEPYHDATDQTWCYCPASNNSSLVPAMKKPRTMHTSVMALNQLFVIGGKTKGAQDIKSLLAVESYNPLDKEWK